MGKRERKKSERHSRMDLPPQTTLFVLLSLYSHVCRLFKENKKQKQTKNSQGVAKTDLLFRHEFLNIRHGQSFLLFLDKLVHFILSYFEMILYELPTMQY